MFKKFAAAAMVLAFAAPALAQGVDTPRLDKREARMEQRIEQGKASGALTDKEAAKLEKRKAKLEKAEDRAKADGDVTRQERKRLNKKADRLNRDIRREKHNAKTASPALPIPPAPQQ